MLLAGRGITLTVNFGAKIVLVRYLTKTEFGAFAYGFAMVPLLRTAVALGQMQTISRFLSLYEERGHARKFVSAVRLVSLVVFVMAALLLAGLLVSRDGWLLALVGDPRAVDALIVVIALGPIGALEKVWEGVLATVARPREIFVRRYVVSPALLILALTVTIVGGGKAVAMAWAHMLAGLGTLVVSVILGVRAMQRKDLFARARRQARPRRLFAELYGFSTPLILTELLPVILGPIAVAVIAAVGTTQDVASYSAVYPLARFNQSVIFTFTILYVPLAARFFAREDLRGASDAYWQVATWLLVLSTPAVLATVALADPVTTLLFGSEYASSAPILVILSLGFLANLSTGFNAQTLQVHGHVRYLVGSSIAAGVLSVASMVLLAQVLGPVGVAIGVSVGLLTQNVLNHVGLVRLVGLPAATPSHLRAAGIIGLLVCGFALAQVLLDPPIVLSLSAAAVASLGLLVRARHDLRIAATFPELTRVPLVRRLVG